MLPSLNGSESRLLEAVRVGQEADLTGLPDAVRSEVFRFILLGLPDPALPSSPAAEQFHRCVIRGARFDSRINLRDGRSRDGGSLPALEFVNCTLTDGLNADGAHFNRLRFENCRFAYDGCEDGQERKPRSTPISLRNVMIEGELRLKNIAPCGKAGLLWLHAKAIKVGTNVRIENAHFRAPKNEAVRQDGTTKYALDFDTAKVNGHLKLHPGVRAEGGIRLQSCEIGGNLWCDGLHASDGETPETRAALVSRSEQLRYALDAQLASVGGGFVLRAYRANATYDAIVTGTMWLLRLHVKGSLHLDGLQLHSDAMCLAPLSAPSPPVSEGPEMKAEEEVAETPVATPEQTSTTSAVELTHRRPAIILDYAAIGAAFSMQPLELPTNILRPFMGYRPQDRPDIMEGSLSLFGTRIEGNADIDADLGDVRLEGCVIGGNLQLQGTVAGLEAPRLTVGGDTMLSPEVNFPYIVNLRRSEFQGLFDISRLKFVETQKNVLQAPRILLRGTTIGRTFAVNSYPPLFVSAKAVDLRCWPEHLLIEVLVAKDPDSEADRFWGRDLMYVNFVYCRTTRRAAVVDGTTLRAGTQRSLSPLQQISAPAIKAMQWEDDEVVQDFVRLFCACLASLGGSGPLTESNFYSIVESQDDLPPSLQGKVQVGPLTKPVHQPSGSEIASTVEGFLRARGTVSHVTFALHRAGYIQLAEETLLLDTEVEEERHYLRPFRFGTGAGRPEYSPLVNGQHLERTEFEAMIPNWKTLLVAPGRLTGTKVDLRDVTCMTLQDEGGSAWKGAKLLLENFVYSRVVSSVDYNERIQREIDQRRRFLAHRPTDEYFELQRYAQNFLHRRMAAFQDWGAVDSKLIERAANDMRAWMKHMPEDLLISSLPDSGLQLLLRRLAEVDPNYESELRGVVARRATNKPLLEVFQPQPYAQLAKVLREQGDEDGARDIERLKIKLQMELRIAHERNAYRKADDAPARWHSVRWSNHPEWRWLVWTKSRAWNRLYGSGFGYGLSLGRAVATLVIFWVAGYATVALANHFGYLTANTTIIAPALVQTPAGDVPVLLRTAEKPYVNELPCGGNINQFLYAVETFTPILNLRQESRCDIRPPHPSEPLYTTSRWLEMLKFAYEITGYLITSLAVLTFSGIARRWDQS